MFVFGDTMGAGLTGVSGGRDEYLDYVTPGILLLTADTFGALAHDLGFPRLVGYLVAGLALGPSALAFQFPVTSAAKAAMDVISAVRNILFIGFSLR